MSWDAIGAIAELLGALGVLGSLIYLGGQIRQNTRMMKQQAFQLGTNEVRSWAARLSESKTTSELFLRGQISHDSLDLTERLQFTMLIFELCSVWATYQQYEGEDLLGLRESAETYIGQWIDQGWFPGWFQTNSPMFPREFKTFVQNLIDRSQAKG